MAPLFGHWLSASGLHFVVHAVDGSLGLNKALEVRFDEKLEGCRLLVDRLGEDIESVEQLFSGVIAVDL